MLTNTRQVHLLSPLCKRGNLGTKSLSNLPRVTQPGFKFRFLFTAEKSKARRENVTYQSPHRWKVMGWRVLGAEVELRSAASKASAGSLPQQCSFSLRVCCCQNNRCSFPARKARQTGNRHPQHRGTKGFMEVPEAAVGAPGRTQPPTPSSPYPE